MSRSGSCLCGAVSYTLSETPEKCGVCHCSMCRKWTGGVFVAFMTAPGTVTLAGEENLNVFTSSEWAERASCSKCGSSMFYRVTAPGQEQGVYHMGLGTLDDASGITLGQEIFIDKKPDSYSFAGDTHKMTEAEVFAMFAPQD
ncbi:GFA family protein [uncultured Shimia sp.]|uniref:GFA family protein n=1 Tax=uncultured Shimia sp. TaxID=573152 RepID=UPI0026066504|nr:GFA family protein [uncultured Shimia sp.]